ncbi:MAG TPA: nucleoside deaminase [Anaerolineales bacterium]|jgi:tRNA(Arg) A34 adenosine deaminase TadA|nr:nucleoside deaminase [Anaerolineales bacterium]
MQIAIEEARAAQRAGDYPYGAVLVRDRALIARGRNQENTKNDPTSHAEMEVLRAAGLQATYAGTIMYASAFPCIMCAGPIVMLGVPEVIVGASWEGYETSRAFLESHGVILKILELEECKQLLVDPNATRSDPS